MRTRPDRGYTFVEFLIAAGVISLFTAVMLLAADPFIQTDVHSDHAIPLEA